jgi:hypothetical protein
MCALLGPRSADYRRDCNPPLIGQAGGFGGGPASGLGADARVTESELERFRVTLRLWCPGSIAEVSGILFRSGAVILKPGDIRVVRGRGGSCGQGIAAIL